MLIKCAHPTTLVIVSTCDKFKFIKIQLDSVTASLVVALMCPLLLPAVESLDVLMYSVSVLVVETLLGPSHSPLGFWSLSPNSSSHRSRLQTSKWPSHSLAVFCNFIHVLWSTMFIFIPNATTDIATVTTTSTAVT